MNSHTKRGGDFVGQVCPTKSTFCMAGRPRYRARCCWGCRVPVRRAPARPARRAPRPSGAAGALGRARALRWGTAGGVPPPAGGGGALRPRAFGAQATHADARCARDRSVRKIKNARIRKHVHKIDPCHFRGHALCWKLQGSPFPLANRPCFMWVKDTGRAAQQGGSFLILILYVIKFGGEPPKKMKNAHFPQVFAVKFSSKDVNLGTKKEKAPCQSRGNVVQ